jgi:hypothetical protein
MKTPLLLLPVLSLSLACAVRADTAPPAPTAPLEEGVRVGVAPDVLAPSEIAPAFALRDAKNNVVSSRAWLGERAMLVLSFGEASDEGAKFVEGAAAQVVGGEQVLAARRVAEAVRGAAPRLKKSGVNIVVLAGGAYFEAMKDALGADAFTGPQAEAADALAPDAPNLFLLRDELPLEKSEAGGAQVLARSTGATSPQLWRLLAGRSASGVSLSAIDRAGFVRLNEPVGDLLSLEPILVRVGDTTPRIAVGQPAPHFALRDASGRVRRLSDLRGQKNLLLSFFPKCFTGG